MMKNYYLFLTVILSFILVFSSCEKEDVVTIANIECNASNLADLRLNHIQLIGSHNSYRLKTYAPLLSFLQFFTSFLPDDSDPLNEWEYNHLPLPEQLDDHNVRAFELDIYYDPNGGIFFKRGALSLVGESVYSGIDAYKEPGLKVLHIPDVDYMTNYVSFKDALRELLNWSNAYPNHIPIFIMLELKETKIPLPNFAQVRKFNATAKASVVEEISDVIPENKLITPNDIRAGNSSLYSVIQSQGWPSLESSRGKFMFFALSESEIGGTVFGTNKSLTDNTNTIVKIIDNPVGDFDKIQEALDMGFIIRTRSDSGTEEARTGETERRDMAIESGAQLIYTDYYQPDERYLTEPENWTDYHFQWPELNAVARVCNQGVYLTE